MRFIFRSGSRARIWPENPAAASGAAFAQKHNQGISYPAVVRTAAIYDLHGNLPALEALLRDARAAGAQRIVVGGDVWPGPMAVECCALLRALDLPVLWLHGNGEREVLAERAGRPSRVPEHYREVMRWSAQQVDDTLAQWLAALPPTQRLHIDGLGDVLFCHATPRSDDELFTVQTSERPLQPVFEAAQAPTVVCGHTHMQFDRRVGRVRVVNAGSAGMAFGRTGADWLLLGPGLELRHTDYDLGAAAARIRATHYPQAATFAAQNVLTSPSADEMLALFARAERWQA
jgi:predicted phosphodiesterase